MLALGALELEVGILDAIQHEELRAVPLAHVLDRVDFGEGFLRRPLHLD